jgi:hypothetical protein
MKKLMPRAERNSQNFRRISSQKMLVRKSSSIAIAALKKLALIFKIKSSHLKRKSKALL